MVEIRVFENLLTPIVERVIDQKVKISVQVASPWEMIQDHISPHLDGHEIELARQIWCEDGFSREFENGLDYLIIRSGKEI